MSESISTHARFETVSSSDDRLLVNTIDVVRLSESVGQTPFYAYDRRALDVRAEHLRAALPSDVSLHYAIKANPMPAVVSHMRHLVDGFDVASHKEMLVALNAGMPPYSVSFAGPAKQEKEIRAAIAAGICLNCESETELQRIAKHAECLGVEAQVAIRVNPSFEMKGSGMQMSGRPRQFGIDADSVVRVIKTMPGKSLRFRGLHIFCGSQNLNAESIIEANQLTVELAVSVCAQANVVPSFVNIGGGYGIPYFPGQRPLEIGQIGNALELQLKKHSAALGATEIIVELGRYLVGEAGYYITRVTDIKVSQGEKFVMVDGGLHHHLSNSGNFGQVLRKNYPVLVANKIGHPATEFVSIVGPLCTPLDIVAHQIKTPKIEIDDLIVVLQSGAYGYTASPHQFLSHPPPAEVLV